MKLLHFESIIDHIKWLFLCKGRLKGGQKAGFHVMLKYFEIKMAFRYYIKQIDSMLPCVWFSNRSQETSKCGKNIIQWHTRLSLVCHFFVLTTFWRHLWSITEQMHGNMESICYIETRSTCFLFLLENNVTRKRKTSC